ncbi:HAMP domain-containing protein [Nocardioides sp.]|uniref:HAMP domain-containing protein n=1 Tax=Nocardioides sp. TaxID=35761 RepID=UPI00238490DC|nr:HAMP domain-containing protein [Nocardioides sp.]MDE0775382.1 HAMP domain-containing protein [Nocardioides sp.]
MRERLTAAFVAITLLVLLGAAFVRSYAVTGELRERESDFVNDQARSIGQVLALETAEGEEIDEGLLTQFLVPRTRLLFERRGERDIVLTGADFDADEEGVSATVFMADGAITVTRSSSQPIDTIYGGNIASTFGLLLLLAIIAGVTGYFVARGLSRPFRELATAAAALGRGRFDLDLPTTRIPEARAIAQALDSSAGQLRERLEREREFGLLASHALRTPLTSLRLTLEELVGDPSIGDTTRQTALDCLQTVGSIGEIAGELVEVSGRGVLVAGAALPLRDVAFQVAQRWSETLEDDGRSLTAAVEGDIELLFTPGPVEQVLDLVLSELVGHHRGDVRLVFEGLASLLVITITCTDGAGARATLDLPVTERTAPVLAALGGRIELPDGEESLRVLLPRR